MWQFILRIFGRSKVEPVKKVERDEELTSLLKKATEAAKEKVNQQNSANNVLPLKIDRIAQERLRNRDIINSIAKGESMAPRRFVKTPATGSKSHNTTPADDVVFIPTMTIQNTYPGYEDRTNTQNCSSYTDSGSSDSGSSCGSGSD